MGNDAVFGTVSALVVDWARMANDWSTHHRPSAMSWDQRADTRSVSDNRPISMSTTGACGRVPDALAHYRPYAAMAQFRREMGKYVDEQEVVRMERYVEIR